MAFQIGIAKTADAFAVDRRLNSLAVRRVVFGQGQDRIKTRSPHAIGFVSDRKIEHNRPASIGHRGDGIDRQREIGMIKALLFDGSGGVAQPIVQRQCKAAALQITDQSRFGRQQCRRQDIGHPNLAG